MEEIFIEIEAVTGVSKKKVQSVSTKKEVVFARHLVIYFLYDRNYHTSLIAKIVNKRKTTPIVSLKRFRNRMQYCKVSRGVRDYIRFRLEVNKLINKKIYQL